MLSPHRVLSFLLVACLFGCQGQPASGPTARVGEDGRDQSPQAKADAGAGCDLIASDAEQQDSPKPEHPDDRAADDESKEQQDVDEATGGDESAVADREQPPEPSDRFLLLIPGGPLIVDLILSIEGESHATALKRLVDEELAAADINKDGRTTWKEVANSERFRYGQFRYNPAPSMRMFDGDEDGLVGTSEFLRFLTRGAGSTQSFVLRTSNEHTYRSRSVVMEMLDDDRDGAIGQQEVGQIAARLSRLDADDDEILTLADFKSDFIQVSRSMSRRRADQPEVAVRINERTDWNYVWYSLSELYADGDELTAKDLALTADAAETLDADQDGTIGVRELKGLTEPPPHFVLNASFGEINRPGESPKTRRQLEALSDHLESTGATVHERPKRILLALPGFRVQFFVNEDPWLYNTSVDELDLDSDGKVGEYELANFMERQRPALRALVCTWVAGHEDPLFAALDTDGDGMLGARELHGSQDLLKSLDRNDDGRVESDEIPDAMVVGFVRGTPLRDSELFAIASSPAETERPSPEWFTAMDTNRDGEISQREFLGTSDQFQQLHRDADGYVGPREARSARGA